MPKSSSQFLETDWRSLESVIEAFVMAWTDSPIPPSLVEYLDMGESHLRHRLAVELVKIDLEQRWQSGLRRLVEDYCAEIPELRSQITAHLLLEEFHARRLAGDDVSASEYRERFPELADSLDPLLAVDPLLISTATNAITVRELNLKPGDSVDDFDLLLILGKGAFATVFLARQRSMQRIVAVKISADKGVEPQTLAQLDHENIVRVYDQQAIPSLGLRLLYMQYAPGGTLASVLTTLRETDRGKWNGFLFLKAIDKGLDSRGESPSTESAVRHKLSEMSWPQVVCWLGTQLSRALHYAHVQKVLHRDLKPANVLMTADGIPKLADFNISFSANIDGATPVSYFGGSLAYMSPEQLEACDPRHARTAETLDPRSDLYSLGVLLWELLTGQLPFPNDTDRAGHHSLIEKMTAQRRAGVALDSFPIPDDRLGLKEVLAGCLEPDRERRYATGVELAREFELCLQPAAKSLLSLPDTGIRSWIRRMPLISVTLITLIPNVVAAIFNFLYNHDEIVEHLPSAEPMFMRIQSIINIIAFPVGMSCAVWLAGSVAKATRINPTRRMASSELAEQRRRCLDLGNLAAIVGLTLWLIAAPVYPIALHLSVGNVPAELYIHFVASLAICGLIAAAFPFFGVTLVAVRCFYPALVDWGSMSKDDRNLIQRLGRQTWMYLVLAASVPMVAIAILVIDEPDKRMALIVLAGGGVFGYSIAVTTFRMIQSDVNTLLKAFWNERQ